MSDLTLLAAFPALHTLDVGFTYVHDLSPLAACTALVWLSCGGTQVSDITPLKACTSLQTLDRINSKHPSPFCTMTEPPTKKHGVHVFA